jgi:multiple sugar transport system substrate-binding protein
MPPGAPAGAAWARRGRSNVKDRAMVTRRRILAAVGVAGAGALLAACGEPAAAPTQAPAAAKPADAAKPAEPTKPAAPAAAGAAAKPDPNAVVKIETKPDEKPAAAQPAKPGAAAGKVFWLVRSTPQENKGQETVFEPLIKEKLPNVQIERVIVPGNQYIPKINSMAAAKESLEIWGFGGNYFDYWARGLTQDLTGYVSGDNWDVNNYFQQGLMDIFKVKGKYHGVSQLTTFGQITAYNKDMFQAAGLPSLPVTWDDPSWNMDRMVEYALKLSKNQGKPDAVYGVNQQLGMDGLPYPFGGDAWLPEHYTNTIAPKTNFNSPEVVEAHQFHQDLIWKHKVMPDPGSLQAMQALQDPFKTGRVGMAMTGGWLFWTLSDIKDFKLGYAALPGRKSKKHVNYSDFWIIGRWAQNKDAAWQVVRVITSVEATTRYSVQSGTPPTPRESLKAWLETVSKYADMSVEELTTLTTGAVDPKIAQESPDHLFLQYPKISTTYTNEILDAVRNNQGTAKEIVTAKAKVMDDTVKGIHDQFKDALPKE